MKLEEGVIGVAPGARLWAVRVLDNNGSGMLSWILNGIEWVTQHADEIEVANMSLGFQWIWIGSISLNVVDVYHPDLIYDPNANQDPDGDSDGTHININRPQQGDRLDVVNSETDGQVQIDWIHLYKNGKLVNR